MVHTPHADNEMGEFYAPIRITSNTSSPTSSMETINNEYSFASYVPDNYTRHDDSESDASDLNNIHTINELLNVVAHISNETEANIVHMSNYNKYWTIKHSEYSTFWNNYCQQLLHSSQPLPLAELPGRTLPVIGRLKFRFSPRVIGQSPMQLFDDKMIPSLVQLYQSALDSCLNYTDDDAILFIAATTISPSVYAIEEDGQPKGEIELRLHFPYCTVGHNANKLIRLQVIEYLQEENIFSHFHQIQPTNGWSDIILPVGPKISFPLYGSSEIENIPAPVLYQIYQIIEEDNLENAEIEVMNLDEAFFPSNHGHIRDGLLTIPESSDKRIWIPVFLSLHYRHKVFAPKNAGVDASDDSNVVGSEYGEYDEKRLKETQDHARQFLDMIKAGRYGNAFSLADILKSTYNVFYGSEEGLQLVLKHVIRVGKIDAEQCRIDYKKMDIDNYLDLKTLAYYARKDNPMKYRNWHIKWYTPAFEQALCTSHQSVAEAFYRLYWMKFLFDGKHWYVFEQHHWMQAENGIDVNDCVTGEFTACFKQLRTKQSAQINNCNDPQQEAIGEIILSKIEKLIEKLGNGDFIVKVVKRLSSSKKFFYERDMKKKFHHNDWVLGIKNGIIELSQTGCIFRPGKPQDYIKIQLPTPYIKDYSWNHPDVKAVTTWFSQMFPNVELYHYVFKLFSSVMVARNRDKIFPILTGKGNNSKSMLKKLIEHTFGDRAADAPVTMVTRKRGNSSGPSPELAALEYALVALMDEPDSDDRIPDGGLKKLISTDSYHARTLNEAGGKCQARFILFMITNEIPEMDKTEAVMSRVLIIPFLSKWVWPTDVPTDPTHPSYGRTFAMDINFEDKIPYMAKAFLWILRQYYEQYCREGLKKRPKIVEQELEKFWRKRDTYLKFIDESIEKVYFDIERTQRDTSIVLTIDQAYSQYKSWMDNYHGNNVNKPNRDEFVNQFSQRLEIQADNGGWAGVRVLMSVSTL